MELINITKAKFCITVVLFVESLYHFFNGISLSGMGMIRIFAVFVLAYVAAILVDSLFKSLLHKNGFWKLTVGKTLLTLFLLLLVSILGGNQLFYASTYKEPLIVYGAAGQPCTQGFMAFCYSPTTAFFFVQIVFVLLLSMLAYALAAFINASVLPEKSKISKKK